jgi:hypothetical protein
MVNTKYKSFLGYLTRGQLTVKQLFDYKLLLLFLGLCSVILLNSFLDPDGFLSPDSTYYLRLSKNLLLNEGFKIADYQSPDGKSFFAIWPVGYPVLIFIVSKLTGLGVVWASKALNLLLIAAILLLFKYIFKETAHWAGLIFFIDANVLIFSFTWSEGPFIFFLICISFSLYKCVESNGRIIWLTGLFLSGIALFMMRYIGLISIGIIGLTALVNLFRRKWLLSTKLLLIASLQLIFAGLYLYHNKVASGYFTGMSRDLPRESNLELLNQLLSALKEEFILIKSGIPVLLSMGLLLLLGIYLYRTRKKGYHDEKTGGLWKYFLLTGVLYLAAIVVIRWFNNLDPINFRFLAPGTFLIILSLACYLKGKPKVKVMNHTMLYLVILATLTIHYIPSSIAVFKYITTGKNYFRNPNYIENTRVILEKYKEVEPYSIVIFGSDHLRYLRENVIPTEIYEKYPLDNYVNFFTQKKDWNVYVNITNDLNPEITHESFIRFMQTNKDKQLVKVR